MLDKHKLDGDMWKLNIIIDVVLYSLPNTYTIPMFTYLNEDSTIHTEQLSGHRECKERQKQAWIKSANIKKQEDNERQASIRSRNRYRIMILLLILLLVLIIIIIWKN